jgi:hypothetical protein
MTLLGDALMAPFVSADANLAKADSADHSPKTPSELLECVWEYESAMQERAKEERGSGIDVEYGCVFG